MILHTFGWVGWAVGSVSSLTIDLVQSLMPPAKFKSLEVPEEKHVATLTRTTIKPQGHWSS